MGISDPHALMPENPLKTAFLMDFKDPLHNKIIQMLQNQTPKSNSVQFSLSDPSIFIIPLD